jgi:hypothetical protein
MEQWERLTPFELSAALEDHDRYHFRHERDLLYLTRLDALIQRNKGLQTKDQIRDVRKFYPFWFEEERQVEEVKDWKQLDKKYKRKPTL